MRRAHMIGYLGLAALSVATFVATHQAISAARQPSPPGPTTQRVEAPPKLQFFSYVQARDVTDGEPHAVYATEVVQKGVASASLEVTNLSEAPGGVVVEATAKLSNGIADQRFVWAMTVLSRDGFRMILQRRYDDQIGLSRMGTIERPTFLETVGLSPGEYFVSVSVQEVPPAGAQALDDPVLAKSMTMTGDGQYIVVH